MYSYQCIFWLQAFIRIVLLVCSRILPVCIPMLPICCPCVIPIVIPSYRYSYVALCIQVLLVCCLSVTRKYSYVPGRMYPCYSYITRMYLWCFSQDPGKRLQTQWGNKKITHVILLSFTTIYFLFFIKRPFFREKKSVDINCQLITRLRY